MLMSRTMCLHFLNKLQYQIFTIFLSNMHYHFPLFYYFSSPCQTQFSAQIIIYKHYLSPIEMKGVKQEKDNQTLQLNQKSIPQLLLSSLKINKSQICEVQQFLSYLSRQEKVLVTPAKKRIIKQRQKERLEYEYIQIYNIRDNQTKFKRRSTRKRLTKNDHASLHESEGGSNDKVNGCRFDKLMFLIEESLCLNSIFYSIAKNEKIHLSFGSKREELSVIVFQTLDQIQNVDQNIFKPITILPQLKKVLGKKSANRIQNRNTFCALTSLVIEVHSQSLAFQQWVMSMKIIGQLIKLIQNQRMPSLQKLQINIYGSKRSYQNRGTHYIEQLLGAIFAGLLKIIQIKHSGSSKKTTNENQFPKLTQMSFNPTLLQRIISKYKQDLQNNDYEADFKVNEQSNHKLLPITKLTLIQIPPSINNKSQFLSFLNQIFSNFPKLTHLTLEMSHSYDENQFKLFNQLCETLHKFCPYLQFLSVMNNDQKIDKQLGLRHILEFYPFLSDLKIKMSPSHQKAQCQIEWMYMNEILWRRLHIQRLINLVRILEEKGFQRYDCMGVMEFMKPLKFPLILPINYGHNKK